MNFRLRSWAALVVVVGWLASAVIMPIADSIAQQEDSLAEAERLNREGIALHRSGKYREAEQRLQRALTLRKETLDADHPDIATSLNNLAILHKAQGQYAKAEPLYRRALAIREKILGTEHPDLATVLNNLALLYRDQGHHAKAEPLLLRALAIEEKAYGPTHSSLPSTLNNLASLYESQGAYAKSEPFYLRALSIAESRLDPNHPLVATILNNLAEFYRSMGSYAQAEPLALRSLSIRERMLGQSHPDTAQSLNNLSLLYQALGHYAKAESASLRALRLYEKTLGPNHLEVAKGLNNLAELYRSLSLYAKAEPLYVRSLGIRESAFGRDHVNVATVLNNLALLYRRQESHLKAVRLYQRVLAIFEKTLGRSHPNVATTLNNLAEVYEAQRRYDQAERLYLRALGIEEKAFGLNHPEVATTLGNLARFYETQGRTTQAASLYQKSLVVLEQALGSTHTQVANVVEVLAALHQRENQLDLARDGFERGRQIRLKVLRSNADVSDDAQQTFFARGRRSLFRYADLLSTIGRSNKSDQARVVARRDGFMVAEQTRAGLAQSVLAHASGRAAAGNTEDSTLTRQVQDLRYRRQAVIQRLNGELGKVVVQRNNQLVQDLQTQRQQLDDQIGAAVERLNKAFPEYAELSAPDPITIDGVEKLLQPGEALLSLFTLDDRLLLWLVRKDKEFVYRDIAIKKADLKQLVDRVRISLDQSKNLEDMKKGLLAPFDVGGAHEFYKLLLAPLKKELDGVKNLIVVPDELFLPLPLGVLVTDNNGDAFKNLAESYAKNEKLGYNKNELADYTALPWLIKDYAITVLPTATSLRALRQFPRTKQKDTEQLLAFGDPVLADAGTVRGGAMLAARGTFVPLDELKKLNSLPGTERELKTIADVLGVDADKALFLKRDASEPTINQLNASGRLAKAEVVAFATHGLISGEIKGLKEPALVLTPPDKPTEENDGLLGLEDILKLKLDSANWVVLSACNTGSADGSGEGLSGLTRAFFFAGAKSLLVSHWNVNDIATPQLMAEIFQHYVQDKTIPRAEALRQGMLALMDKAQGRNAFFAHPYAWAPFFLVGDSF